MYSARLARARSVIGVAVSLRKFPQFVGGCIDSLSAAPLFLQIPLHLYCSCNPRHCEAKDLKQLVRLTAGTLHATEQQVCILCGTTFGVRLKI